MEGHARRLSIVNLTSGRSMTMQVPMLARSLARVSRSIQGTSAVAFRPTLSPACTYVQQRGMASASTTSQTGHVQPVENVQEALRLLNMQPNRYVVASITGRTFVLSASDVFTLPRLAGVKVGDVLELDLVHEVGSRDYTLRAQDPAQGRRKPEGGRYPLVLVHNTEKDAYSVRVGTDQLLKSTPKEDIMPFSSSWAAQLIPAGLAHVGAALSSDIVKVRCVVVEHTKGPLERIEKFKRRKGYDKVITHKQPYTRVRVDAITLGVSHST